MDQNLNQQNSIGKANLAGSPTPPTPPPPGQTPIGNPPPPFPPSPIQPPPPSSGMGNTGDTPQGSLLKSGSKTVLLAALAVGALVLVGGIYFLAIKYSGQGASIPEITPIPRISPSPTPPLTEATEADINTIDLSDPEDELKSIDQDANQL